MNAVAGRIFRNPCSACLDCAVRHQAVCSALADDEVSELERILFNEKLDANETLVDEGEPRRFVYSLTSGMLRLTTLLADGRRQISGFLVPGDYVGLADDAVYSQSVEAVVPSNLCGFSLPAMNALMERHPRLRDRLHQMTRTALRQAHDNQLILGRLAPVEKIASFLLITTDRLAAAGQSDDAVTTLPMTRADIADFLGLTIETVSRSFTKLRNQALIRLPNPHDVEIIDRRALQDVAGFAPR